MDLLARNSWKPYAPPAIAAGVAALFAGTAPPIALSFVLCASVAFLAMRPMLGWSLVVLTYPFIYVQVFLGRTINIPYVDAIAMLTAIGVALRLCCLHIRGRRASSVQRVAFRVPGLLAFCVFLAAAALSLLNVQDLALGVKFLVRPLTFFYAMFIVLPVFVIDRPRRLFTTFRIMFIVGCIAAAMGIWSLAFPPEPGAFRRAVPIIVHGMTPLGANHNLIAEVLVSVIPIGAVLALFARGAVQRWYVMGTALLGMVTLLTFSRNGWLTLAIECIVLLIAVARLRGIAWRRIATSVGAIAAMAIFAISAFSMTTIAQSSNTNRLRLTAIAFAQFREHPIIGAGVGTFQDAVLRDRWYIADFGQPQEAHGLVQKLLAETGILGFLAFSALLASIVRYVLRVYQRTAAAPQWRLILLALLLSAAGSIVFQLFNTSYFVSKLWLPLGVAVAAARLAERGIALRARTV